MYIISKQFTPLTAVEFMPGIRSMEMTELLLKSNTILLLTFQD